MSKALSYFSGFPLTTAATALTTYEVSLIRPVTCCRVSVKWLTFSEPRLFYTAIITAENSLLAIHEALHQYFVDTLIARFLRKERDIGHTLLLDIDIWASDLAFSVVRRLGTADQVISAIATPWEPDLFTIHFESRR